MTDSSTEAPPSSPDEEGGTRLLEIAIVLAKHKKLILGLPFAAAVVAAVVSLLMTSVYTATTKILPPQQSQSTAAAMLGQLGNLTGIFGGPGGGSRFLNPNDLYVAMLKSRTVADNLIKRFDLVKLYDVKLLSSARRRLEGDSSIVSAKDGIITIQVDDTDPRRAADIANAYVEELFKFTKVLAVTEASKRRLFFEQQFQQAKDNLAKAEIDIRQALEKGGLVKVDDQGRAMIEMTARLRAQISVKEVQMGAMRTFAAPGNPELRLVQQEVDALKGELAKLEGDGGGKWDARKSDNKGLDNLRLLRDVKYYELIYELLAKQYEIAKIDEAKDSTMVQVMDPAIQPDLRSRPKRTFIVLATASVAGVLSVLLAFVLEAMATAGSDPEHSQRVAQLREYLRIGRRPSIV